MIAVAQRVDATRVQRGRTVDERLMMRLPWLFPVLLRRGAVIPATSSLRRRVLHRQTVSAYAAVNRDDFELMLRRYSPSVVYENAPELVAVGLPLRTEGVRDWLAAIEEFRSAWSEWRFEPHFVIDAMPRYVSLGRISALGRASGARVDYEYAQVIDVEDGLVVRERDFNDWRGGLAAAGFDPEVLGRLERLHPREALRVDAPAYPG